MTEGGAVPLTQRRLSAGDVALAGLEVLRREPAAALAWAGASLAMSLVIALVGAPLLGPEAAQLRALPQPADPARVVPLLTRMAPRLLLLGAVLLVFYAVMNAAMYRAMLRPQEAGWRRLRLGGDELRQVLVFVAVGALLLLIDLAVVLVAGMAAALLGGAASGAAPLVRLVFMLVALAAIWLAAVRLSLAGPATFEAGRPRVLESWRLTRGATWPLLGAYLLAFVFLAMLAVALWLVSAGISILGGGAAWAQGAGLVLSAVVFPLNLAFTAGPPAAAYRRLASPPVAPGGRWPGAEITRTR